MIQTRNKKTEDILLGVIVDVSSSMKNNWKVKGGGESPKIEVVKNAINNQIKKHKLSPKSIKNIETFCLGMGFKLKKSYCSITFEEGEEVSSDDFKTYTDVGVVCDIIALAEIYPSKDKLLRLGDELNNQWKTYAEGIVGKAEVTEKNSPDDFKTRLSYQAYDSAIKKYKFLFSSSFYEKFYTTLTRSNLSFLQFTGNKIDSARSSWLEKINYISKNSSDDYISKVVNESQKLFDQEFDNYSKYIEKELEDFLKKYIRDTVTNVFIGHELDMAVKQFNKVEVEKVADRIFSHLESEVKKSVSSVLALNNLNFYSSVKSIGGHISVKELKSLTESCVYQYSWKVLQPFINHTVEDVFKTTFKSQVAYLLPKIIEFSSKREVIRPIDTIPIIFPELSENDENISHYMFGSTPMSDAIRRASFRFVDRSGDIMEKYLVIISDGEFDSEYPMGVVNALKRIGVKIISCYLSNQDIITKLTARKKSNWPTGAKTMFDMASHVDESDSLLNNIKKLDIKLENDSKLFYQINNTEVLEKVFESLLSSSHTNVIE